MFRRAAASVIVLLLAAAIDTTAADGPQVPPCETNLASPIYRLKVSDLHDTFNEFHLGHRHEAIDIMQPRGTPIHAVTKGTIRKLHWSRAGGNTIYEFDDAGEYCYYYAHLDRYADNLREGSLVSRGDVIGYVGSTGDSSPNAPHLHLAIYRLGSDRLWWRGTPINPYPILVQTISGRPARGSVCASH
jgi:murein DD-endopeptidase MepM/ murein hydrolase activator NlpD